MYGINTGFGSFADVVIEPKELTHLQYNLIRSHAAGVGEPLPLVRARMLLVLRINVLAKGHSGIRVDTVMSLLRAFNADVISEIPSQGTVGASGDLAPLAHLALGLIGEGRAWCPTSKAYVPATEALRGAGLTPLVLHPKEGLALINGTQFITALGTEAVVRAERVAVTADVVAAITLEALRGTYKAFDPCIHAVRPHPGQVAVARRMWALLGSGMGSAVMEAHKNCSRVQDSYTLRCIPQVHGVVHDTVGFVKGILQTEMNSATDNPMVFADMGKLISGGNFHGEYPAKACDYLAIAVHELANISERRIERLNNTSLSDLPAFLVKQGGINSGFMIAHCTAAALVSENKVHTHPASTDSISTSAAKEDHVSMGGYAARKALTVVENVEKVIAIELLCACQGIEFLRPLTLHPVLEKVHALLRTVVKPWDQDRFMAPDIEAAWRLVRDGRILTEIKTELDNIEKSGHV